MRFNGEDKQFRSGDDSLMNLREIFDMYFVPLCVYAYKYLDSYEKAEDVVQEVFIKVWNNKNYIIEKSIKQYLYTAVRNNSLKVLEKESKYRFEEVEALSHEIIEEQFEPVELEERIEKLYKEVNKLPESCRLVFEGIVFEKKKYAEVAEDLEISINTVKTQYSRALKRLRGSIDILILILMP
ncbi:RNA polymerase sigma-70 factor [Carboxylicivirga marina]|uniref:RNA polymerase sigma-70 factor n=1 Tax=Carboxylicivirga marina TaxID=2800988 RepID=A0ABS1HEW1_9BACT|nr:RNA polymerase sigma-70 factor [Carboxylicivirga marina]MBK3515848.1 RNA polymerase sigma-70 factor [Carboxylicivirga marina]